MQTSYGFAVACFALEERIAHGTKSRKHQTVALPHLHSETAGYIRLSVTGKDSDDSIENQKKVIEDVGRRKPAPHIPMIH